MVGFHLKQIAMIVRDNATFRAIVDWGTRSNDLHRDGYVDVFTSTLSNGYVRKMRHRSTGRIITLSVLGSCVTQLSAGRVVYKRDYVR